MALSSTNPVNAADITIQHPDGWGRIFVDIVGEIAAGDDKVFEQRIAGKIDLPNLITADSARHETRDNRAN